MPKRRAIVSTSNAAAGSRAGWNGPIVDLGELPSSTSSAISLLAIRCASALDHAASSVSVVACGLAAVRRAWRAGLVNHRYRFTTASAFGPLAVLLAVAATLKVAA